MPFDPSTMAQAKGRPAQVDALEDFDRQLRARLGQTMGGQSVWAALQGHNSSVVSPPGKPGAYYWTSFSPPGGDYIDPDNWLASSPRQDGSWWPVWRDWLISKSHAELVSARRPRVRKSDTDPLGDAPGAYVYET